MDCVVPEVTIDLGNNRTHSGEEGTQSHLFTIASVDWFACFSEDEEGLPDCIEFSQFITDVDIFQVGIEILFVEEVIVVGDT